MQPGKNPLIKICDFGYSIDDQSSLPKTKVGTPGYTGEAATASPEPGLILSEACSNLFQYPSSSSVVIWLGDAVPAIRDWLTHVRCNLKVAAALGFSGNAGHRGSVPSLCRA